MKKFGIIALSIATSLTIAGIAVAATTGDDPKPVTQVQLPAPTPATIVDPTPAPTTNAPADAPAGTTNDAAPPTEPTTQPSRAPDSTAQDAPQQVQQGCDEATSSCFVITPAGQDVPN